MLARMYDMDALLALVLALPLLMHLAKPRFALPRILYRVGAALAFCGWLVFSASGGTTTGAGAGFVGRAGELYLFFAPFLLPIEAGYLEWVGLALSSHWLLLEFILAAGLSPIVAALVIRLLRL